MRPRATTIPANLPGFGYDALNATAMNVRLTSAGSVPVPVPVTIGSVSDSLLQVKASLTPGTSYTLDFDSMCQFGAFANPEPIHFTAGPEAPLPTKLGDFKNAPTVSIKDFGTFALTVIADFTLASEMTPWAGVYDLNLALDGRALPTKTLPEGPTVTFNAQGWCEAADATKPTHQITLQGRLPFTPLLETAPQSLTFSCPAPDIHTPTPTPTPSPTSMPMNPSPAPTASPNPASPSSTGTSNGSSGGHGCSVSSATGAPGTNAPALPAGALALAGLALAFVRQGSRRVAGRGERRPPARAPRGSSHPLPGKDS
jgi:hypothetical protein